MATLRIENQGQSEATKMVLKSNMFKIKAIIYIINFLVEVMSESKGIR